MFQQQLFPTEIPIVSPLTGKHGSVIYVIWLSRLNWIKAGTSTEMSRRIKEYQSRYGKRSGDVVVLVMATGGVHYENYLLSQLGQPHHGREYYQPCRDVLDVVWNLSEGGLTASGVDGVPIYVNPDMKIHLSAAAVRFSEDVMREVDADRTEEERRSARRKSR